MKLVIRIFALSVVVAGVAAAATTPRNTLSLSAISRLPKECRLRPAVPECLGAVW